MDRHDNTIDRLVRPMFDRRLTLALLVVWMSMMCAGTSVLAQGGFIAQGPDDTQANGNDSPDDSASDQAPADTPTTSDGRLASPRNTVMTFLEAIHEVADGDDTAWQNVMATLDLSRTDAQPNTRQSREIARDLWGTLNRIREIDPEQLPGEGDLPANQSTYTLFPRLLSAEDREFADQIEYRSSWRISLLRHPDGRWLFSPRTIAHISDAYAAVSRLQSKVDADETQVAVEPFLRQFMPAKLKNREMLELEYWQWLALLVLILIAVVIDQVIRILTKPTLLRLFTKLGPIVSEDVLRSPSRPLGLLFAAIAVRLLLPLVGIEGDAEQLLTTCVRLFLILSLVWTSWRLTDLAAELLAVKAQNTSTKFDDVLVPLIRKTLKIFIVVFGIIYGAEAINIPVMPMLASLGIVGVAFGFAAKDTVENFFGSVAVLLDRPFDVGDWVVIGDTEGTVEEVGFRSTRIRTFYNSQITVPNSNLVRATVDNFGRRQYRRWKTHIGVQYDTTPDKLVAFTEGIRELVRTHPYTRKDYYQVWMHQWSASSMDVLLYIFFEVPDWNTELRERERMFLDIVRLADQIGVQFAFPTQTVHLFKQEHSPYETKHDAPTSMTDRRSMITGIRAAQQIIKGQQWINEKPGPVIYSQVGPTDIPIDEHGNPITDEDDDTPKPGSGGDG